MSARLTLLALSTLVLGACDGNPLQAVSRQAACCCDHCPTAAAPGAVAPAPHAEAPRERRETARVVRVRHEPAASRETRYYRYESSDEAVDGSRYGGRYGARGGGYAGVSVAVQESESTTERYSYRESAEGYAYAGAAPCCAGGAPGYPPQQGYTRYKSASTTPGGWLEWPGKVED